MAVKDGIFKTQHRKEKEKRSVVRREYLTMAELKKKLAHAQAGVRIWTRRKDGDKVKMYIVLREEVAKEIRDRKRKMEKRNELKHTLS